MKKKLFAALAAALMLGSTMAAPASAAETYKKGDVNMDGDITVADAQLALMDYTMRYVAKLDNGILTPEQIALASIVPTEQAGTFSEGAAASIGAAIILMYATDCIADPSMKETDIQDYADKLRFYEGKRRTS